MTEKFSVRKRIRSFAFAFKGLKTFIKTQHNGWIHCVVAIFVIAAGFFFQLSVPEWLFVVFAIGFVFVAEIFNTAIEFLVNLLSPNFNSKAGLVKDIAAGAVLVAAFTAVVVGIIIFYPKIIVYF